MKPIAAYGIRLFALLILTVAFGVAGCASSKQAEKQTGSKDEDRVEVGYGSQDRKDVTGSVTSVKTKEAEKQPVTRAEDLLKGRVSGVQVYDTPGGGIAVRIRGVTSPTGSNEPLYVVDGIPMAPGPGGALTGINPRDIASIEVLKGASAAIYGVRGANGVIVVKTKRGGE